MRKIDKLKIYGDYFMGLLNDHGIKSRFKYM